MPTQTQPKQKTRNPNWGGARRGTGPLRRNIHLSDQGAVTLRLLLEWFRLEYPTTPFTADSLVDAFIQQAAERLQESTPHV